MISPAFYYYFLKLLCCLIQWVQAVIHKTYIPVRKLFLK